MPDPGDLDFEKEDIQTDPDEVEDLDLIDEPEDEDAPEEKPGEYSPDMLRAAQMATYRQGNAEIKDESEGARNYRGLTKVWMPLILDEIGEEPWTVGEVIEAMTPVIRNFAREFSGHRPYFQFDDAMSVGIESVLNSLIKDGGRSPFALFAAKQARRAISRAAKGAGFIPTPVRKQTYTDKDLTSLDIEKPETKGTLGGTVGSETSIVGRQRCPQCGGSGKDEGDKCDVCVGKGYVVTAEERPVFDPGEEAETREALSQARAKLSAIVNAAGLSPRQTEIFLMANGLEGLYDPNLVNTGESKQGAEIAEILAASDQIMYHPPYQGKGEPPAPTGLWPLAVERGKTDEFQEAWEQSFGDIPHSGPFNPNLPASLQIAPLTWHHKGLSDKGTQTVNHIPELIANLRQAVDASVDEVPAKKKSRTFVHNLLKKISSKIDAVKDQFSEDVEMRECIDKVFKLQYLTIMDWVERGIADPEDIELAYIGI